MCFDSVIQRVSLVLLFSMLSYFAGSLINQTNRELKSPIDNPGNKCDALEIIRKNKNAGRVYY